MVVLRGMISIQHVDKAFNENPVLQDVSFDIPDGQIFGVFGKSGIGKSTLAKVLCGICPPDAGTITLDDQILVSADHPYDRRLGIHIQMVYQQPYAILDPAQKIGAGFIELIRYHRFSPKGEELSLTKEILDKVGPCTSDPCPPATPDLRRRGTESRYRPVSVIPAKTADFR